MRRCISILLAMLFLLSLTACGGTKQESSKQEENESGTIEVEKEIFNVKITLPAALAEGTTQEDLDQAIKDGVYHTASLNEDGSVTIKMSKQQHKKCMDNMAADMEKFLQEMVGSEDYPNFTDVQANQDYTHFTGTTTSEELDMMGSFSVLGFYMMGGMYAAFNGDAGATITVDFVNADSGKTISSANSSDMGE